MQCIAPVVTIASFTTGLTGCHTVEKKSMVVNAKDRLDKKK